MQFALPSPITKFVLPEDEQNPMWLLCAEILEEMLHCEVIPPAVSTNPTMEVDVKAFNCARPPAMTITNVMRQIHRHTQAMDDAIYVTCLILVDRWREAVGAAQITKCGRMYPVTLTALIVAARGTLLERALPRTVHALFPDLLRAINLEAIFILQAGSITVGDTIIQMLTKSLISRKRDLQMTFTEPDAVAPLSHTKEFLLLPMVHNPVHTARAHSPPTRDRPLGRVVYGCPPPTPLDAQDYVRSLSFNRLPPNSCTLPRPLKPIRPRCKYM